MSVEDIPDDDEVEWDEDDDEDDLDDDEVDESDELPDDNDPDDVPMEPNLEGLDPHIHDEYEVPIFPSNIEEATPSTDPDTEEETS